MQQKRSRRSKTSACVQLAIIQFLVPISCDCSYSNPGCCLEKYLSQKQAPKKRKPPRKKKVPAPKKQTPAMKKSMVISRTYKKTVKERY
ncbi:hypothetical protein [Puia sp.]|jgi:hypothetical protein|uniref:hypothetical protein n=1 Tax=Puia sp. TaxID=2045100 RepID=UPI002F3F09C1